jgi:hypothetical protein
MSMQYQPPSLIGAQNANVGNAFLPPIKYARAALHKVRKGYPMRGTYCEKHAQLHKQYEMLEQQRIAEEHGLSFSAYIPTPKVPKILESAPLTSLRQSDIESLAASGWTIKPPQMAVETPEDELFRLTMESHANNNRIIALMTQGTPIQKTEEEEVE